MAYALDLNYGRRTLTVFVQEHAAPGETVNLHWHVEDADTGRSCAASGHLYTTIRRAIRRAHEWRVGQGKSLPISPVSDLLVYD